MNKKIIKNLSFLMLVSVISTNVVVAKSNFNYQHAVQKPQYQSNYYPSTTRNYSQRANALRGQVITVPAGVQFPAVVSTPISSEFLKVGQSVSVTLGSDFYYNSVLIAPAGSTVMGTVINVKKAKHGSINGSLRLRFTELITPYGTRIPIFATVKTNNGSGLLIGGTKSDVAKSYVKDMGVGAGAGALAGLVASAISGGSVGKGTAIMTGVGMVGGLAKSVYDRGENVVIPSGATIELRIDQPITVNPSGNNYDY